MLKPPNEERSWVPSALSLVERLAGRISGRQLCTSGQTAPLTASELLLVCKVIAASQALGKKRWPDRVRKVKQNSIQLNLRVQKDMRESFSQRLAKLPLAIWLLCPSGWSAIRMIHLCHISRFTVFGGGGIRRTQDNEAISCWTKKWTDAKIGLK